MRNAPDHLMKKRRAADPNARYHAYLRRLRAAGRSNMYGAIPYLAAAFGLDREAAFRIVCDWIDRQAADGGDPAVPRPRAAASAAPQPAAVQPSLFDGASRSGRASPPAADEPPARTRKRKRKRKARGAAVPPAQAAPGEARSAAGKAGGKAAAKSVARTPTRKASAVRSRRRAA